MGETVSPYVPEVSTGIVDIGGKYQFAGEFTPEGGYPGKIRRVGGEEFEGLVQRLPDGTYQVFDFESGNPKPDIVGDPQSAELPSSGLPEPHLAADGLPAVDTDAEGFSFPLPEPAAEPAPIDLGTTEEELVAQKAAARAALPDSEPSTPVEKDQALTVIQGAREAIQKLVNESRAGREIQVSEAEQEEIKAINDLDQWFDQRTKLKLWERQRDLRRVTGIISAKKGERASLSAGSKFEGLTLQKLRETQSQLSGEIESIAAAREHQKRNLAKMVGVRIDESGHYVSLTPPAQQETSEAFPAERISAWHQALDEEAAIALDSLQKWEDYLSGTNSPQEQIAALSTEAEAMSTKMQDVLRRAKPVKGKSGTFKLNAKDQAEYDGLRIQRAASRRKISKLEATRPAELRGEKLVWGHGSQQVNEGAGFDEATGEITPGTIRREIWELTGPRTEIGLMYERAVATIQGKVAAKEPSSIEPPVVPTEPELPAPPVEPPVVPTEPELPSDIPLHPDGAQPELAPPSVFPVEDDLPLPPVEFSPAGLPDVDLPAEVLLPELPQLPVPELSPAEPALFPGAIPLEEFTPPPPQLDREGPLPSFEPPETDVDEPSPAEPAPFPGAIPSEGPIPPQPETASTEEIARRTFESKQQAIINAEAAFGQALDSGDFDRLKGAAVDFVRAALHFAIENPTAAQAARQVFNRLQSPTFAPLMAEVRNVLSPEYAEKALQAGVLKPDGTINEEEVRKAAHEGAGDFLELIFELIGGGLEQSVQSIISQIPGGNQGR